MALLWASRAASRLRISVFHRGFYAPLGHKCLGRVDADKVKEDQKEWAKAVPDYKKCIVKTFKHPSEFENGMWMVGSNIYLVDEDEVSARDTNVGEDEEDTTGERWINEDHFGKPTDKRRLIGGIRYKVDDETGIVGDVQSFMLSKYDK